MNFKLPNLTLKTIIPRDAGLPHSTTMTLRKSTVLDMGHLVSC